VSVLSAKLRTQRLDGSMPIDPERSGRASGRNRRFGERIPSKGNLFDGVALPGRKPGQGRNETSGLVHPEGRFFRVAAGSLEADEVGWLSYHPVTSACFPSGYTTTPLPRSIPGTGNTRELKSVVSTTVTLRDSP